MLDPEATALLLCIGRKLRVDHNPLSERKQKPDPSRKEGGPEGTRSQAAEESGASRRPSGGNSSSGAAAFGPEITVQPSRWGKMKSAAQQYVVTPIKDVGRRRESGMECDSLCTISLFSIDIIGPVMTS